MGYVGTEACGFCVMMPSHIHEIVIENCRSWKMTTRMRKADAFL